MVATLYIDSYRYSGTVTTSTNQLLPGEVYRWIDYVPYKEEPEPILNPLGLTGGALDWWRFWVSLALLWHSPKRGLAVNSWVGSRDSYPTVGKHARATGHHPGHSPRKLA